MSVALPFLIKINDHAASGLLDQFLSSSHLRGTFTFNAVEDVTADARGMNTTQNVARAANITITNAIDSQSPS